MRSVRVTCSVFTPIALCLILFLPGAAAEAETFEVPSYNYFFDVPEAWESMDLDTVEALSFRRRGEDTVFQALTLDGESFPDAEKLYGYISQSLSFEGEPVPFRYNDFEAVFAEISFTAAGERVYGYSISINDCPEDLVLIAYAPESRYDQVYRELLSCLDGFSAGRDARLLPGPVSQYQYPWPGPHTEPVSVEILGRPMRVVIDPTEKEVSQILIEREAEILAALEELDAEAWSRYYTLIYRDTYPRFAPFNGSVR
ncbi:MAG: hypothetical protein ACOCYA_05480, partial [Spirochaetota bacterium]